MVTAASTTTTMQFILELPVVLYLADWVWGEDTSVTPHTCLDTVPFMPSPCWTGLLAKAIGIAIILAACLNKLPVILNLLASKSAEGTPSLTVYGETLVYANSAAYGYLQGHPMTAWGENVGLLVQSLLILLLIWRYSPPSFTERSLTTAAAAAYISAVPQVPSHYLLTTSLPLLLAARGAQLLEAVRCQHTGSQSMVTVGLNLLGSLVRILTTLREVGWDWAVLGTFLISGGLSALMLGQVVYYRKNTERFLADLQMKKEKKAS